MSAKCQKRTWPDASLNSGNVFQLPRLVEEGCRRPIEAEDRKPAFSGHCLDPVSLLLRLIRPEDDVYRAVGIDARLGVLLTEGNGCPFCNSDRLSAS